MMGTFFSTTYNRVLGTMALVGLVAALGAYAYYTLKQAEYLYAGPVSISVMGEGEVLAVPDIGQFTFTVIASGSDATIAQDDAGKRNNDIIAYLKEQGVEERHIKTEQYSLYPRYRWEQQPCAYGQFCPGGEQVQDGFEVSQTVSVKVKELSKAGNLITGVGERGATNLSGLTFTVEDEEVLKTEARALAIANAKQQAEELAKQLDVRIVRMINYYDETVPVPYADYGSNLAMDSLSARVAEVPILPTGEQSTKSRVSLVYQVE